MAYGKMSYGTTAKKIKRIKPKKVKKGSKK